MLNKTVVVPVLSGLAMVGFTVWALLVGPPDAAHAGERATTAAAANTSPTYCAVVQPKSEAQ